MNINKSIIDQRINKIVADNPTWFLDNRMMSEPQRKTARAFLILGMATYLDIELEEGVNCLTDDGNDAGIDGVHIGDTTDEGFVVTLFQSKYYSGKKMENDANFEENAIVKMIGALQYIFDPNATITLNDKLKRKIVEIQDLAQNFIPTIRCVMMSNGIRWNEVAQEKINYYQKESSLVEFDFFNHDDILRAIQTTKSIQATLRLNGKAITEELPQFKRVMIGKITAATIADLLEHYGDDLLEKNIRKYLGHRQNKINQQIQQTLLSDKKENFYLYNNGITMICSKFSENGFATDKMVKVDDLQIINGGQTCKTIQHTVANFPNIDYEKAFVMFRLYEIDKQDEELITNITLTTNSQSPVDLRDLKANDSIQRNLETAIADLGYIYKRKREVFGSQVDSIAVAVAAEAVMAIWRENPHIVKYQKAKLFGKYYDQIFTPTLNASQVIMAVLIFRFCDNQRRKETLIEQYPHLPYSHYVMAMLIGKLLLNRQNLTLKDLQHKEFPTIKQLFDTQKDVLFQEANQLVLQSLTPLQNAKGVTELRKLVAHFRQAEVIQDLLKKLNKVV